MPRRTVYISSTYEDLIPYRNIAASVISDCGHIPRDSYAAGAKPTVEQCLADVENADVLVGIVGLRYGWVPPDGDERSITHREFDQAREKLRLIFFLQDKGADLAEPIKRFRQLIPASVLPAIFQDYDDFSAALRKTIRERMGIVERVPPLLPYYCDRTEQYQRIDDLLWDRKQAVDSRLLILVVQADEFQSGSQFIEVLRARMPRFPATRDLGEPVSYELEWPNTFHDPATFRGQLVREFADKVTSNRHASQAEIEQTVKAISGPILIHTYLLSSEWKNTGRPAVLEFYRLWDEWTELSRAHPLIVILRVEYELARSVFGKVWPSPIKRANRDLRAFLQNGFQPQHSIFEVLTELPRVARDDAERWSRLDEVRRFLPQADLEPHIRDLYRFKFYREPAGQPCMEPLAKELGQLIRTLPSRDR